MQIEAYATRTADGYERVEFVFSRTLLDIIRRFPSYAKFKRRKGTFCWVVDKDEHVAAGEYYSTLCDAAMVQAPIRGFILVDPPPVPTK